MVTLWKLFLSNPREVLILQNMLLVKTKKASRKTSFLLPLLEKVAVLMR